MEDPPDLTSVVAVRPVGGLCNRLRVISSFQLLARYTGRTLRVCWAPSFGFSDEELTELFENEFERIDETEFEQLCEDEDALRLHEVIAVSGVGPDRMWRWAGATGMADVLDATARPVIAYQGTLRLDRLVGPDAATRLPDSFPADYLTELRTWRPVERIRREVDELTTGFDARTVGVHVRRGDAVTHPRIGSLFRQSSDAAFFARMDQLRRDQPETTFFLATDSAETEGRFRERYGTALVSNRAKRFVSSVHRGPKENQRDAVIDLFAIARTGRLLGTSYSSFSTTAAELGELPLEIVLDHSLRRRAGAKLARTRRRLRDRVGAVVRRMAGRDQADR